MIAVIAVAVIDLRKSTNDVDVVDGSDDEVVAVVVTDEPTEAPTYAPTEMPSSPPTILQSEKPHIIFILADDLGWNSMGYQVRQTLHSLFFFVP